MFLHHKLYVTSVRPETYPLGEKHETPDVNLAHALVSLSHSPVEQRIYSAMLMEAEAASETPMTARGLLPLTGIRSLSTLRRGLEGLMVKLSIEREPKNNGNEKRDGFAYKVYTPDEILIRRKQRNPSNTDVLNLSQVPNHSFERAVARVAENSMLSRREAQVALCCIEGLTNAEIGKRLDVTEQTVKFHLRHVFIKFGVKRRAELISRLLM